MVKVVSSQQRRMVIWFVSLRNQFVVLSRLRDNDISSLMRLSLEMVLKKMLLIYIYIYIYIYMKVNESSFIFLMLYVNDILLTTNNIDLLAETKHMLCNQFDMKDLGEASFVLGLTIVRDRINYVL